MVAFFDTQNIVQLMVLQCPEVGRIGTQAVFRDDQVKVRVILTQLRHKPFGSIAFAIILRRAIVFHDRFGHEGNHFPEIRMDDCRPQHLMIIRDLARLAMDLFQTRRTVNRLGGEIAGAIERQEVAAIEEHDRLQRFASLQLGKHALEHGADKLGGYRIEDFSHLGVARHVLNAVDRPPSALCSSLIKRQQRGRFQRKHGKTGHESVRQRNISTGRTLIQDVSKTFSNEAKESICGQVLPSFWRNRVHGQSRHEDIKWFTREGHFRTHVYEKATESMRLFLGFVACRELLTLDGPINAGPAMQVRADGPRRWLRFRRDETTAAELIAAVSARYRIRDLTIEEPEIEALVRRIYEEGL